MICLPFRRNPLVMLPNNTKFGHFALLNHFLQCTKAGFPAIPAGTGTRPAKDRMPPHPRWYNQKKVMFAAKRGSGGAWFNLRGLIFGSIGLLMDFWGCTYDRVNSPNKSTFCYLILFIRHYCKERPQFSLKAYHLFFHFLNYLINLLPYFKTFKPLPISWKIF